MLTGNSAPASLTAAAFFAQRQAACGEVGRGEDGEGSRERLERLPIIQCDGVAAAAEVGSVSMSRRESGASSVLRSDTIDWGGVSFKSTPDRV